MGNFRDLMTRLWSVPYLKHPVLGILSIILLLVFTFVGLSIFTRHGREFPTPNFCEIHIEEAREIASKNGFNLVISDSIWIASLRPGEVLDQTPSAGCMIKRGRRIFLTIKSFFPPTVQAPDLRKQPIRQATMTLRENHLEIGELTFPTYGETYDNVRQQFWKGEVLEPGTLIPEGSYIDLALESTQDDMHVIIPAVAGMKLRDARFRLAESLLNVGKIEFDKTVKTLADSLAAQIYSTYPRTGSNTMLPVGAKVDLWLTKNASRIVINQYKTPPAKARDKKDD